jgi:hypothetical protein
MVRWSSLVAAALAAVGILFAGNARADVLSACGGAVESAGNVSCSVETMGGCTAQCTPVNFEVACSAQLEASCMGSCTGSATASCTGTCQGNCTGQCTANPGSFSCQGSCETDCEGSCSGTCSGQCMGSGNMADCMGQCSAQCKASCGTRCNAQCTGTPPSASCDAKCTASCQGSCTAQANLNCDVSCQAKGYAGCTSSLQGGCQAQCTAPSGAVFCNGQWINASDVQNCVNQIESLFNIQVSGSAMAGCEGGTCSAEAQGKASASCDMSPNAPPISGGLLFLGVGGLAAGIVRRRIRRSR